MTEPRRTIAWPKLLAAEVCWAAMVNSDMDQEEMLAWVTEHFPAIDLTSARQIVIGMQGVIAAADMASEGLAVFADKDRTKAFLDDGIGGKMTQWLGTRRKLLSDAE